MRETSTISKVDLLAKFFACFAKKLAPAGKISTSRMVRLARFCNSENHLQMYFTAHYTVHRAEHLAHLTHLMCGAYLHLQDAIFVSCIPKSITDTMSSFQECRAMPLHIHHTVQTNPRTGPHGNHHHLLAQS